MNEVCYFMATTWLTRQMWHTSLVPVVSLGLRPANSLSQTILEPVPCSGHRSIVSLKWERWSIYRSRLRVFAGDSGLDGFRSRDKPTASELTCVDMTGEVFSLDVAERRSVWCSNGCPSSLLHHQQASIHPVKNRPSSQSPCTTPSHQ